VTSQTTRYVTREDLPALAKDYLAPLREAEWVVYAKRPFAGPEQVLDYVGRYTHRVAISNNRLLDIAQDKVTFRYKDYRHDAQQKTMTVEAEEFIRASFYMYFLRAFSASAPMASWPTGKLFPGVADPLLSAADLLPGAAGDPFPQPPSVVERPPSVVQSPPGSVAQSGHHLSGSSSSPPASSHQ
jgi:hypothetical protein